MPFTPAEQQRLREAMSVLKRGTTYDWRYVFSYAAGRHVTIEETEAFLREENIRTRELTAA